MTTRAAIPRHQRFLFWALALGILSALAFLLYGCRQAEKRLAAPEDETPIAAPTSSGQESVPLFIAHDADGSLVAEDRSLALPSEPSGRARILLEQLLSSYALPGSPHPLPSGQAVDDVFLVPLPLAPPPPPTTAKSRRAPAPVQPLYGSTGELAVVNLHGSFVDSHPSGVEIEALTLDSIIGTLHADLPDVTAVRFLVDGHDRDTLAGHADLLRTYPAIDPTYKP